jgi:hypothetical protein
MIQGCDGLSLAMKSSHTIGILRKDFRQDFDRDIAIQSGVAGAIHFTHPALA